MNGIILINKEKNVTSRDVVNKISKKLNTKKVGHAGTLDPLATGLLVIGVGSGTKILELLTLDTKEYIATVKIGLKTDTLDITGNVISSINDYKLTKEELEETLLSFVGTYNQTVPKYSAVKINGKKLYDYARNNIDIELPKRLVTIYNIELLDFKKNEFTFKVLVSKGTYIRSLIKDIGERLNILMTMKDLIRTKSGKFLLDDSSLVDLPKIIKIEDALDFKKVTITDSKLLKRIKNGNSISLPNINDLYITLLDENNNLMAIYKNNGLEYVAFKVF